MPGSDPGEGFYNTNYQLFSTDKPAPGAVPTNRGFVLNFKAAIASDLARRFKDTLPGTDPSEIMGMYFAGDAPGHVAVWQKASPFAIIGSPPCRLRPIPNRSFAAAATSQGHLDNHVKVFTCSKHLRTFDR